MSPILIIVLILLLIGALPTWPHSAKPRLQERDHSASASCRGCGTRRRHRVADRSRQKL